MQQHRPCMSLLAGAAAESNTEPKKVLTQSASGSAVEILPKRKAKRPSKAAPTVLRVSLTVPAETPQPSLARPQSAPILAAPTTSVGRRSARPNSAKPPKRKPPPPPSCRHTEVWGPGPPTPLVRWAMRAPLPPPPPPPPPPSLPKGRFADLAWTIMRPADAAGASRARDPPDLTSEARPPPSFSAARPSLCHLHPTSAPPLRHLCMARWAASSRRLSTWPTPSLARRAASRRRAPT